MNSTGATPPAAESAPVGIAREEAVLVADWERALAYAAEPAAGSWNFAPCAMDGANYSPGVTGVGMGFPQRLPVSRCATWPAGVGPSP